MTYNVFSGTLNLTQSTACVIARLSYNYKSTDNHWCYVRFHVKTATILWSRRKHLSSMTKYYDFDIVDGGLDDQDQHLLNGARCSRPDCLYVYIISALTYVFPASCRIHVGMVCFTLLIVATAVL